MRAVLVGVLLLAIGGMPAAAEDASPATGAEAAARRAEAAADRSEDAARRVEAAATRLEQLVDRLAAQDEARTRKRKGR